MPLMNKSSKYSEIVSRIIKNRIKKFTGRLHNFVRQSLIGTEDLVTPTVDSQIYSLSEIDEQRLCDQITKETQQVVQDILDDWKINVTSSVPVLQAQGQHASQIKELQAKYDLEKRDRAEDARLAALSLRQLKSEIETNKEKISTLSDENAALKKEVAHVKSKHKHKHHHHHHHHKSTKNKVESTPTYTSNLECKPKRNDSSTSEEAQEEEKDSLLTNSHSSFFRAGF